jgi:transmembrane protein TMEM260 (protein O-mannosyltransferase)
MTASDTRAWSLHERIACPIIFLAALALYVVTLAPSYVWGDSTKLLFYVLEKQFVGLGAGFGTHPLHNALGYAFSLLPLSFPYSQNLLSAVFAAASVCVTYCIIIEAVGDIRAALAASVSLAVSHVFWLYAVINESYSLLAFSILLALFLSLKWTRQHKDWHLYALGFVLGAGLANHALLLLAWPGLLYMVWEKRLGNFCLSWKCAVALLTFLLGSCQILFIPIMETGSISSFVAQLTGDSSETYQTFSGSSLKFVGELSAYPFYLLYQFPGPAIALGVIGGVVGFRQSNRLVFASALIAAPILLFAAQYMKQRQFAMMLPAFSMFALWVGFGTGYVLERFPPLRTMSAYSALLASLALLPPAVYYTASHIAEAIQYDVSFIRHQPYRNPYSYYLYPPKHREYGPQRYVEDSFKQAKPSAIILADFVPGLVMVYEQRVLGKRKDLELDVFIDDWVHYTREPSTAILKFIRSHVGSNGKALYLADDWEAYYHSSDIRKEFHLERTGGPLWEVTPREGRSSPGL